MSLDVVPMLKICHENLEFGPTAVDVYLIASN